MKLYSAILVLAMSCLLGACNSSQDSNKPLNIIGLWRGVIQLQEQELPFHFRLSGHAPDSLYLTLINGKEELEAGQVHISGDTLIMPMHIFDTEIRAQLAESGNLQGYWIKNYADDYKLPFKAKKGESFRFETAAKEPAADISGRWSVSFLGEDSASAPNAVGIFQQQKQNLQGTFLTPTGDYRYLEGNVSGDNFYLSAFDGEHAYLFKGKIKGSNHLEGMFWSGKSWEEKWQAVRSDTAALPPADSLTYLKEGYDRLQFTFPNLQGQPVSLSDPRYKNKVVVVQLLGTWCPNCMDETKFLSSWYERNKQKDVAIIGLAYEKKNDFAYAKERVEKMADNLDVGYDILIAGTADNEKAAETLPMLNHVMAFPTTIFVDKQGNVRRIHTGFSGPGTGEAYEIFVEDFNRFMEKLLQEPASNQK